MRGFLGFMLVPSTFLIIIYFDNRVLLEREVLLGLEVQLA